MLGDQVFDALAYCDNQDPLEDYTTSWRGQLPPSEFAVWVAGGITFSGFIFQFVGLRGLHPSISITQIRAIEIRASDATLEKRA